MAITAVLWWVVGSLDGNAGGVAAALMLGVAGAGLAVLGLGTVFGRIGLVVGSALALLLGNPLSGLASAPELLPRGGASSVSIFLRARRRRCCVRRHSSTGQEAAPRLWC